MPDWSYVVVVLGTALALGLALWGARGRGIGKRPLEAVVFIVLNLLILHISEFSVYSESGGTILQGRYLLPVVPAALLIFLVPLARAPARVQTAALGTAVATWGLAAGVGLASALSFFAS